MLLRRPPFCGTAHPAKLLELGERLAESRVVDGEEAAQCGAPQGFLGAAQSDEDALFEVGLYIGSRDQLEVRGLAHEV